MRRGVRSFGGNCQPMAPLLHVIPARTSQNPRAKQRYIIFPEPAMSPPGPLPRWRSPEFAAGHWIVLPPLWHQEGHKARLAPHRRAPQRPGGLPLGRAGVVGVSEIAAGAVVGSAATASPPLDPKTAPPPRHQRHGVAPGCARGPCPSTGGQRCSDHSEATGELRYDLAGHRRRVEQARHPDRERARRVAGCAGCAGAGAVGRVNGAAAEARVPEHIHARGRCNASRLI